MATITTYKCSKGCGMMFKLHQYFPIWRMWVPKKYRKVPIRSSLLVKGYTNEEICSSCRKIIEVKDKIQSSEICPDCRTENSLVKLGDKCPLCGEGIVVEGSTKWF